MPSLPESTTELKNHPRESFTNHPYTDIYRRLRPRLPSALPDQSAHEIITTAIESIEEFISRVPDSTWNRLLSITAQRMGIAESTWLFSPDASRFSTFVSRTRLSAASYGHLQTAVLITFRGYFVHQPRIVADHLISLACTQYILSLA